MTRLEIIQSISPRFNYAAYRRTCEAHSYEAHGRGTWAQLMGMLTAAESMYPEDTVDEAYQKFLALCASESAEELENQIKQARAIPQQKSGCGSCGGGKVR